MIPTKEWLDAFDMEFKSMYAVGCTELGWDEDFLGRWCDLSPREAAERLGMKYDLIVGFTDDYPKYWAKIFYN